MKNCEIAGNLHKFADLNSPHPLLGCLGQLNPSLGQGYLHTTYNCGRLSFTHPTSLSFVSDYLLLF